MGVKRFERCPKCGKRGLHVCHGYVPRGMEGMKRCRYCGHVVPRPKPKGASK